MVLRTMVTAEQLQSVATDLIDMVKGSDAVDVATWLRYIASLLPVDGAEANGGYLVIPASAFPAALEPPADAIGHADGETPVPGMIAYTVNLPPIDPEVGVLMVIEQAFRRPPGSDEPLSPMASSRVMAYVQARLGNRGMR